MLEDKILIWKLKHGNESALSYVYEKYRRLLLKIACGLLRDPALAEDVVQDVFLTLAASTDQLRVSGSLKGYLIRMTLNRARNVRRSESLRRGEPCDEMDPVVNIQDRPDQWLILQDEHQQVNAALARLPLEQREVVTLHLWADLTFKQIAGLGQCSMNTAQSRYRYGLDKLRTLLCNEDKP